ncbi:MAG: aldo/keto reductase [Rhizobiaceae bacterium]|nr:aldo/keto reductase [Rhizobiaceae bacterium]
MEYRTLGRTDLNVSRLCLGSMTWGTQNTIEEGHEQIDYAVDHGVNFIDTAEMYPVNPISKETQGASEVVIGDWFEKTGRRNDMVLATKVSGNGFKNVRDGIPISGATMREALESSLKRLKTETIDLYQLHWPNRGSYHFRQYWTFDATKQKVEDTPGHILDVLETAAQFIKEGKIRHLGLSNESCWGTGQFLKIADANNLPRVATIQNEYNLLYRTYDLDLAELSHHEDVDLICYSPVAAGILSGKYIGDKTPAGSRRSHVANLGGRYQGDVDVVTAKYVDIAKRHDLDPTQMALAFCLTRPFMGSVIFGAVSMEQLKNSIGAADVTLSDEVLAEIQTVYRAHTVTV